MIHPQALLLLLLLLLAPYDPPAGLLRGRVSYPYPYPCPYPFPYPYPYPTPAPNRTQAAGVGDLPGTVLSGDRISGSCAAGLTMTRRAYYYYYYDDLLWLTTMAQFLWRHLTTYRYFLCSLCTPTMAMQEWRR